MNPQLSPVEYADVDDTIPYSPLVENDHGPDCRQGNTCVNCGGCACGLVPRACDVPAGCYSQGQAEQDNYRDEYDDDGGYEDYDDDWYGDDGDVEHDDGDGAGCDCGTC